MPRERHEKAFNGVAFWIAAISMAALIAATGVGAIAAGIEASELGLILFGLGMAALSAPYFYRYHRGLGSVPRFALFFGVFGILCFLGAAYVSKHAL